MMVLFDIREKITSLYQKYDYLFKIVLKFLLVFFALNRVKGVLGYSDTMSRGAIILVMAIVAAFLPSSLMVIVVIGYVFLQLLSVSSLMALTILIIFLVLYSFCLRFSAEYNATVVAVPVLRGIGFPYVVPLGMGLFGNLLSVIPTACGVFAYYTLTVIKDNVITLQQAANVIDNPLVMYMEVLDKILKNPAMYVTMFIYAAVIISVYFVRRLNMDYSFEIAIGVGTGVMMLGFIVGSLKYDMGVGLVSVLLCSLISAVLVFVFLFFYRVLDYAATEHVQFEDDDYYYYVKAVPKIKVGISRKPVKKVITKKVSKRRDEEEELEEEALEAMDAYWWSGGRTERTEGTLPKEETEEVSAPVRKAESRKKEEPISGMTARTEKNIDHSEASEERMTQKKTPSMEDIFEEEEDDYL